MKNTLTDLNNYLFEAIERINDDSLDEDGLDREIRRSQAVTNVAGVIINNASIQLKAVQHMDEFGYTRDQSMPLLLAGNAGESGKGAAQGGKAKKKLPPGA